MFGPFRKERPFMGWIGYGGGAAAISKSGVAAPKVTASGGNIANALAPVSYTHLKLPTTPYV